MATCTECGAELPSGSEYCPHCGHPVERKRTSKGLLALTMVLGVIVVVFAVLLLQGQAKEPTYPLQLTIEAPGLDENGSRVPVHVSGTSQKGEQVDVHAYAGMTQSDSVSIPQGTYTVSAEGSPISSEGVIYAFADATAEVVISGDEGTDVAATSSLQLVPIEAADVTDEQVSAAVDWAQKDPQIGEQAEALGARAIKRRDEAAEQAEAQRSRDAMVDAYNAAVDAAPADFEFYALQDVTGDDVPELLISVYPGRPQWWQFYIYVFDAQSGELKQIDTGDHHPDRDGYAAAPDGHGLVFVGYYGEQYSLFLDKVVDGEVVRTEFDPAHVQKGDDIGNYGVTKLDTIDDRSNREPIEALRSLDTSDKDESSFEPEEEQKEEEPKADEQDDTQQRIEAAYANNPSTLAIKDYAYLTGTVCGEYKNLASEPGYENMGWQYWLEVPEPITVSTGYSVQELTVFDLPVRYEGSTRVDEWQDYLDKVVTIQGIWGPSAQGGKSSVALNLDYEVVEVF